MNARLEACYFGPGVDGRWDRMAAVLRQTATDHCPGWAVNIVSLNVSIQSRRLLREAMNTAKLKYWNDIIQNSEDGDRVLLIDTDTVVLRPLDPIWEKNFDLAYTVRPATFPLNGGVVFVRVSPALRAFFQAWVTENVRLIDDSSDQPQAWRNKYGGVNQAALAHVLDTNHGLRLATLPCLEWNCEDTTWHLFDPAVTRILHIKSALRLACLESQPIPAELAQLAAIWKARDRAARARLERAS